MDLLAKARLTIGTKLVGLIAALLLATATGLVWTSTRMFTEDNTALIQQMNADTAASLATQTREFFESLTEKMRVIGTVLVDSPGEARGRMISEFFHKDKDFLAVALVKHHADGKLTIENRATSPELSIIGDPGAEKSLEALAADRTFSASQVARGEVQLSTLKLVDGSPAVAIGVPFIRAADGTFTHTLTAFVRQARFVRTVSESDVITSFMVDRRGKLIAHPDAARVAAGESVAHLGVVKQLLEGKFNNGQTRYVDGETRLGAFRTVGFAGLGVIAEVPEAKALEASYRVKYRSMLLAGIVLCVAFFIGFIFAGTITWPIKQLVIAAGRIQGGDFAINLRPRGKDEIAHLATAFNDMARGLEERDKVKDVFNKFHNKEIAEKLLDGHVKLGGERLDAVIFFSDVRGFTALSESMSPEDVVEMLNEYMTRMVSIIRAHKGIVDKYVGDAIMAIWGVPEGSPDDVFNAVGACLAMREDLAKLNDIRIARGQPVLKIGMGLNRGSVIAGNIGSVEKMEYTVIGDAVNLASRIESMTKEYGADLLISKTVYEAVKDDFIFEQCKSAKVKGKSTAIELFRVRGFYDENRKPIVIETPYSTYASEKSDKAVHDEPAASAHPVIDGATQIFPADSTNTAIAPAAIPPAAVDAWYLQLEGELYGPFSTQELTAGVASGEIPANTLASPTIDQPRWAPVSAYPQLGRKAA